MNPPVNRDGVKEFVVPDLGEGLEEVTLSSWCVVVGDDIELNQTLCSVETAKAEVEIPSPYAGRIIEVRGAEGDVLAVGSLLARIDTAPDAAVTASEPATDSVAATASTGSNGESPTRRPVLVGYGADDALDSSRRSGVSERPKAKPSVRKLAAELLVDLGKLVPGPDGLISREAVLAAAGGGAERPGASYDVLPVRGVHAQMAERITQSRNHIPDAHASVDVDCTELVRLRDGMCATGGVDADVITPFALTLRFLVIALKHNKLLNSTWVDGPDGPQVRSHHAVHLGFAVAAPRGLLVPVITDAQDKTTRELAECVARLIRDARAGTLKPTELAGSTFTVSNFGALGLDGGVPVINYPEAAILGIGSLKPRPMVIDD
ncbi:MAG: 2-oxo acid dehydrogenase subunit E2, partial [Mycobacterium sp.]|nr:2-oxo acid dehydrogenase subunit E2 [Mycobacterium sp.]